MLTNHDLKYHFHPENGWMHDPNGLVYFQGHLPLELTVSRGKLLAYPAAEVRHLVDANGAVTDAYIEERFINDGEEVHIRLLEK